LGFIFSFTGCSHPVKEKKTAFCKPLDYGTHVSDPSQTRALLWAGSSSLAEQSVRFILKSSSKTNRKKITTTWKKVKSDGILTQEVHSLSPNEVYTYELQQKNCRPYKSSNHFGSFKTLPDSTYKGSVQFAIFSDLGGQEHCRKKNQGYPFNVFFEKKYDFIIGAGDLIYADNDCTEDQGNISLGIKKAGTEIEFRKNYFYQLEDSSFQKALSKNSIFAIWDDHEVEDNFDSSNSLMTIGRKVFLEIFPTQADRENKGQLYRSHSLGKNADLWILDTRQYRSSNTMIDSSQKTMLGKNQLEWLINGLSQSKATWKLILSSVPLSIPTGPPTAHDGWANGFDSHFLSPSTHITGFEKEFFKIRKQIIKNKIKNIIFLTADAHRGMAIKYLYHRKPLFYEWMTGAFSAAPIQSEVTDPSLNPTVLFHEGKVHMFTQVKITEKTATAQWIDTKGNALFTQEIKSQK
tara:strand:- start:60 stop:1448 length:1389 start_codon:yes stop_codon:yes gene_type:complete